MNTAQLLTSASSVVLTVLTDAGAALAVVQQVQSFVAFAVQAAEGTGAAGADKLTAVLNAVQSFLATAFPNLKVNWSSLAVQIKAFVAGLVALWNSIGVFVTKATQVVGELKAAV